MSSEEEPLETETRSHRAGGKRTNNETENMKLCSRKRKIDEGQPSITAGKRVRFNVDGETESDGCEDGDSGEESVDGETESDGCEDGDSGEGGDMSNTEDERESDGYIEDSEQDDAESTGKGEREGEGKSETRYLPPHLRGRGRNSQRTPSTERLQRVLQGLVNRYDFHNRVHGHMLYRMLHCCVYQ